VDQPKRSLSFNLPFTASKFVAACEKVKDLPLGSDDNANDWPLFISMLEQIRVSNANVRHFLEGHLSNELAESPVFEILLADTHGINPPVMVHTVKTHRRFRFDITAMEFLDLCRQVYHDVLTFANFHPSRRLLHLSHPAFLGLTEMLRTLHVAQIDLLDFLSFADTVYMMQDFPLLSSYSTQPHSMTTV
jgi:hypothetical protein